MELSIAPVATGTSNGAERRLAECGIRPTAQRVRIATLLLSAPQHLSAEQILAQLRAAGARVSKATVYNTLNLFAGGTACAYGRFELDYWGAGATEALRRLERCLDADVSRNREGAEIVVALR